VRPPVNRLRAIGDVLLSSAVLPGLRRAHPGATVDFLTEKFCAGVVEGNPHVSQVLTFDSRTESGASLIRRVRAGKYDLVLDLFGNPRSALLTLLSGASLRVGYRFNWRALCYNVVVEPRGGTVHNVEFNLDALARLGIDGKEGKPFFPVDSRAEAFADGFFRDSGLDPARTVALNAGGGWISKKWRPEEFASLGRRIVEGGTSRILVIWGPGEEQDARRISGAIGEGALPAPPTSLGQLGSLLKRCSMLVTNDSGPMHIAAALGVPVLAIFGPTLPALQGPVFTEAVVVRNERLDCLGCSFTECPIGNPCMVELTVDEVYASFRRLADVLSHPKRHADS